MSARDTTPATFLLPGWLREPMLSTGAAKEFREILPYWAVAMVTSLLWLVSGLGAGMDDGVAWAFYLVGELAVVAMGAASFGHEFAHRTLLLALSQPCSRQALWWRKMRVLGVAMASVAVVRLAGPLLHGNSQAIFEVAGLTSLGALGFGLLVAPWFALWSRSTLAGTVFTVALPIVTWQAASLVAVLPYGLQNMESAPVQQAALRLFVLATLAQWGLGPVLSYRTFRRLEAIEGRGRALRLPRFLAGAEGIAAGGRRPGKWRLLARKELRLLAPAYLVAGLYLLIGVGHLVLRHVGTDGAPSEVAPSRLGGVALSGLMEFTTLVYAVLVTLLTGSLACAEDRHAGTLVWHLAQPLAVWRQWMVKAAVALTVALVLGLGLPLLLLDGGQVSSLMGNLFGTPGPLAWWLAGVQVVALCTLALYISTLTGSAMRAMLWAAPISLVLETLVGGLLDSGEARAALWNWLVPFETEGRSLASPAGEVWVLLWGLSAAGALLVPLACAGRNFRRLDQSAGRVASHVGLFAGYALLSAAACSSFKSVMSAVGATLPMRAETVAEQQAAQCAANISEICGAVSQWAIGHGQRLPDRLAELTNELESPQVLVCPADRARHPATNWASFGPSQVSYTCEAQSGPAPSVWAAEISCPVHGTKSVVGMMNVQGGQAPTNGTLEAPPGTAASTGQTWRMDARMLRRYGLMPHPAQPPRTNADPAAPAP